MRKKKLAARVAALETAVNAIRAALAAKEEKTVSAMTVREKREPTLSEIMAEWLGEGGERR